MNKTAKVGAVVSMIAVISTGIGFVVHDISVNAGSMDPFAIALEETVNGTLVATGNEDSSDHSISKDTIADLSAMQQHASALESTTPAETTIAEPTTTVPETTTEEVITEEATEETSEETEEATTEETSEETEEATEETSETVEETEETSEEATEETTEETTVETTEETTTEEETTADPYAKYEGLTALAQVSNYVNVRKGPTTDDEIVGKIYNNCAATIINAVDGEDGLWYNIQSGNVTGFIKAEFFVTGEEAEAMKKQIGITYGKTIEPDLRVRSSASLDNLDNVLYTLELGSNIVVLEDVDDFYRIKTDEVSECYVHKSCVETWIDFDVAVTLEEEAAEIARREEAERIAAEALKSYQELIAAQQAQQTVTPTAPTTPDAPTTPNAPATPEKPATPTEPETPAPLDDPTAALRNAVVAYALQFVGNPYVHAGRSLVTGTDCSGFTMLVYSQFGYGLAAWPEGQATAYPSVPVDLGSLQPGDLLFYANVSNGSLGHVAMYIGNGQIVHAASPEYGICIWDAFYRMPAYAVRVIQ